MTISTAGMIEAIRIAAKKVETQEEQDCLNLTAIRIDTLTVANTSMSLELNSIRQALLLPAESSVQASAIAAFCRLQRELQEATTLANRLRRTAKEYQEENQQLRTELVELKQRLHTPIKLPTTRYWSGSIDCFEKKEIIEMLNLHGLTVEA